MGRIIWTRSHIYKGQPEALEPHQWTWLCPSARYLWISRYSHVLWLKKLGTGSKGQQRRVGDGAGWPYFRHCSQRGRGLEAIAHKSASSFYIYIYYSICRERNRRTCDNNFTRNHTISQFIVLVMQQDNRSIELDLNFQTICGSSAIEIVLSWKRLFCTVDLELD